ncbi:MAG TPA: cell division inhibitor SidA [Caulobacteraceae bacterium]|jgi:hypothetical protein
MPVLVRETLAFASVSGFVWTVFQVATLVG